MSKFFRGVYLFDDFTIDLDRGCLMRDGNEVKLRPKSFEVLKYLVEHHGQLVSTNDLVHAVWADACVTDDSLVQCMVEVRRALGDESRRYVKTVPRRGYIFETQVSENAAEAPNQAPVALSSFDSGQISGYRLGNKLVAIVIIWNIHSG